MGMRAPGDDIVAESTSLRGRGEEVLVAFVDFIGMQGPNLPSAPG